MNTIILSLLLLAPTRGITLPPLNLTYDFAGTGNIDAAKFTEVHCFNGGASCTNGITTVAGVGKVATTFDTSVWKAVGTYNATQFLQLDSMWSSTNSGGFSFCLRLGNHSGNISGYCAYPTSSWNSTDITLHDCRNMVMTGNTEVSCGYLTQVTCTGGFSDATVYTIKGEIAGTTVKISKNGTQCGSDIDGSGWTNQYTTGSPGIIGFGGVTDPALNTTDNAVWTDADVVGSTPARGIINNGKSGWMSKISFGAIQ